MSLKKQVKNILNVWSATVQTVTNKYQNQIHGSVLTLTRAVQRQVLNCWNKNCFAWCSISFNVLILIQFSLRPVWKEYLKADYFCYIKYVGAFVVLNNHRTVNSDLFSLVYVVYQYFSGCGQKTPHIFLSHSPNSSWHLLDI